VMCAKNCSENNGLWVYAEIASGTRGTLSLCCDQIVVRGA